MNDDNENQPAENTGAASLEPMPDPARNSTPAPKGKGKETKPSPRMKILVKIILILALFGIYSHIAGVVNYLRVGVRGKMGDEWGSVAAVGRLMLDNPSAFFTGDAHVMFACTWIPELMHRWYGLYLPLKCYTFTTRWDDKEWNLYVFTEKEEDAETIKRNLASMVSDVDGKSSDLCVRSYHVYFYHSWPPPSTCDPNKIAKMPSYADFRLDLDHL